MLSNFFKSVHTIIPSLFISSKAYVVIQMQSKGMPVAHFPAWPAQEGGLR